MSTDTAKKTVTFARLEVEMRLYVDVPLEVIVGNFGLPMHLKSQQLLEAILEDTDRLPNALDAYLESGAGHYPDIDVCYDDDVEIEPPGKVEFSKPKPGFYYTRPIPNFISGNVKFTEEGIEHVMESSANRFTPEQLRGAFEAGRRIWGLRKMGRPQQVEMGEYISELQWGMLSLPELHRFKPGEFEGDVVVGYTGGEPLDENGDVQPDDHFEAPKSYAPEVPIIEHRVHPPELCRYCGQPEDGHDKPK